MPNKPIQLNKWSLNSKGKSDKLKEVGASSFNLRTKIEILNTIIPGLTTIPRIKERRYRGSETRCYIHIGRELQRQIGAESDYFSAPSQLELIDKLYEAFTKSNVVSMSDIFDNYLEYRKDLGINPKTIREDYYGWNRHFKGSALAEKPILEITPFDIKNHFLKITANSQITKTCFKNSKGLLNGILTYCLEQGMLTVNPLLQVDFKQFNKRFKPINPNHDNYSKEEITSLIQYFREKESSKDFTVYDYAVWFSLNACMRIGEIKALKFSDFKNGTYSINKEIVGSQDFEIDDSGNIHWGKYEYSETAPKGNASSGFRDMPMTEDIAHIVDTMRTKYPNNEYLFMTKNHNQLRTANFNRHLQWACEALDIPYRSSHTIRFSNCDGLFFNGGIGMHELQAIMGHSTPAMTSAYLNRHSVSDTAMEMAREYLSAPQKIEKKPCIA